MYIRPNQTHDQEKTTKIVLKSRTEAHAMHGAYMTQC